MGSLDSLGKFVTQSHQGVIDPPPESVTRSGRGMTDSPALKFGIGFLAGGCALIFPRFLALLAQSDDLDVTFFPRAYTLLIVVVAIVIGLVMMIFEYQVSAKPRETFMTALGLPAVIAGALGTASSLGNVSSIKNDADRVQHEVRQELGIAKEGSFTSLQSIESKPAAVPAPARKTSLLPAIVSEAHAESAAPRPVADGDALRFGIQLQQPRYVVVLKEARTQEEAVRAAQAMKQQLPTAQAVKTNTGYFVVLGDAPRSETDALLAAARAKKALGDESLRPVLVEVK